MIHVGVAEWKTARDPDRLRTTLGSCVGVLLYEPRLRIGGLAHALLAEPPGGRIVNRGKYARTAVETLLQELAALGARQGLVAQLFGGASMFEAFHSSYLNSIGEDNVQTARAVLQRNGVPVVHEDVGGRVGRALTLHLSDGRVVLKMDGRQQEFSMQPIGDSKQ